MIYKTNRALTLKECPWLDDEIKKGIIVYKYTGYTYECVSESGTACSMKEGESPFFELPTDSLDGVNNADEASGGYIKAKNELIKETTMLWVSNGYDADHFSKSCDDIIVMMNEIKKLHNQK